MASKTLEIIREREEQLNIRAEVCERELKHFGGTSATKPFSEMLGKCRKELAFMEELREAFDADMIAEAAHASKYYGAVKKASERLYKLAGSIEDMKYDCDGEVLEALYAVIGMLNV